MTRGVKHPDPEAALAASEALYRATFDQAALGIAHVGLDGRWLRVNDRLCAITGYSRAELLGRHFADITHPDDLPANLAYVDAVREGRAPTYTMEKRYRRRDHTLVWVKLAVSVLRGPTGQPKHFISTVDDISDRKRAEAALHANEQLLRQALDGLPEIAW
ncbi:MAG: PAS domain S-box protein, partial [Acetobacteraceae bacterium]